MNTIELNLIEQGSFGLTAGFSKFMYECLTLAQGYRNCYRRVGASVRLCHELKRSFH